MSTKQHASCIEALQDLMQINNDRIEGYTKAIKELKDTEDGDLKKLFTSMISESQQYNNELSEMLGSYGGKIEEGTTVSGKFYRAWMDVKALFSGGSRKAVLENCEAGEDAAQKAYQMALDDSDVMPETKELIRKQKSQLRASHDKIRDLRDVAAA